MNLRDMSGVARIIRTVRSPLGIVALLFILLFLFAIIVLLWARVPDVAKYVLIAVPIGLAIALWCSFWSHAKKWPAPVSEEFFLKLLEVTWGRKETPILDEKHVRSLEKATATPDVSAPAESAQLPPSENSEQ